VRRQSFERREELRETFDRAASVYDDARPSYPAALFDDIVATAGVTTGARLLEIGSGSGIATRSLAEREFAVVGVELSTEMAQQARANLSVFPTVSILTGSFEEFTSLASFDGVVAFSSFHWIQPETRALQVRSLLRPGGFFAVADARWSIDDREFARGFEQDCRRALGKAVERKGAPGLTPLADEMRDAGFKHLVERRYVWKVRYSAERFIALLSSLPWYLSLAPGIRRRLFALTEARINAQDDGSVTTSFEAILDVAVKVGV
jgi:SAM-dependent methyltransferase